MTKFKPTTLKIRPYARLLTMLGDQLIKNERVALVELIKNAYDADATWVKVTFEGFSSDFQASSDSKIIIEDNGRGMTYDVIVNHWANPATPVKLVGKKTTATTKRGRIIQGEKGIGRFALLKIGKKVSITTRAIGNDSEFILGLDVSKFENDFIDANDKALFLDDLALTLRENSPAEIIIPKAIRMGATVVKRRPYGTKIEISHLPGIWSKGKVAKVYEDLARLQSIFDFKSSEEEIEATESGKRDDKFEVFIYRGNEFEPFAEQRKDRLGELLESRTVLNIEGSYVQEQRCFDFALNGRRDTISLSDARITGLKVFRDHFGKNGEILESRGTESGSFKFKFYVFDFSPDAAAKFELDDQDRKLIKEHRIYLYRDGIRVYPYGDPDDDWLLIDVRRGTVRASEFLSNDQVVGYVNISQSGNPHLQDKTSREGLVDVGNATDDFRALLQIFLAWVRKTPYGTHLIQKKKKDDVDTFKKEAVQKSFDEASQAIENGSKIDAQKKISEANRQYKAEKRYLVQRAETTEHLAGVGLSVEAASHDLMLAMARSTSALDALLKQANRGDILDPEFLQRELSSIRGLLSFVEMQMKDMQQLFGSSKQRKKSIRIEDTLEKVYKIYSTTLNKEKIEFSIENTGSPLVAKTTEAVLLQLFLNLFDNAVYWLQGTNHPRKIEVLLDGTNGQLIFADSGPGFRQEDIPYIFEPFYSGKGEDGRGLGLYIAKQLLERQDYTIDIAERSDSILGGANIAVTFIKDEN
ncbi:ATP-binding protein [Pseudomonas sp. 18175]|uniref:ATP-binding protein n=1 Tax=Pseudomonas sp. 18175 TaxID=3390056 RepID=UPI003D1BBEA0